MRWRIGLAEIGYSLILVAFLLSVAGIVEPSSGTHAAVAVFTFAAFALIVTNAHHEWSDGYECGCFDSSVKRLEEKKHQEWERSLAAKGESIYKCGLDDCYCLTDPAFKRWSK